MKIFLAEADPNIRYGLRVLCEQVEGAVIIGEAANMQELLDSLKGACPDALLIREVLPGISAVDLEKSIWQVCPQMTIFLLYVRVLDGRPYRADNLNDLVVPVQNPEQLLSLLGKYQNGEHKASRSGFSPLNHMKL